MKTEDRHKERRDRLARLHQDRARRINLLIERGWIQSPSDIPANEIPIDINTSTKANLTFPEVSYADIEFICRNCGKLDNWWADQQQVYFEDLQSSPHKSHRLCYDCRIEEVRRRELARKSAGQQSKD